MLLKNRQLISLLLITAVIFYACDSTTEEEPTGSFQFGNTTYQINDGLIQDLGMYDLINDQSNDSTHYLYLFTFSDGNIITDQNYYTENGSYIIFLYCFSPLTATDTTFTQGAFKYCSYSDYYSGSEDLRDQYFYVASYILFDSDANGNILPSEERKEFNDGVVNINGADSTFQVFMRIGISLGTEVNGSYKGDFEIIE